jgi:hypothetical protein
MDRLLLWEAAAVSPPSNIFSEVRLPLLEQENVDLHSYDEADLLLLCGLIMPHCLCQKCMLEICWQELCTAPTSSWHQL